MTAAQLLGPPAPLTNGLDFEAFDCGEPALNAWLRQRAHGNEGRFSRTFAVCDAQQVAGFYALTSGSVERTAAPGRLRRNAPEAIPVAILARLAVDRGHAGRGLGVSLLADALQRVARASESIGIAALLVHAKTDAAKRFYLNQAEFIPYPADSRILFLPIETIVRGLP